MAFVSNFDPNEKDPNQAQGPVAPGGASGTVKLSPGSGVVSSGGQPTGASPASSGGQFATLNQYLAANQDKAAPLANTITQGIQNQYNTLQGQNTSTLSGIQGQVAQGAAPQGQSVLAAEAANPVSFASQSGNVPAFQNLLNAKYTGPEKVESTPDYQKQLADVNQAIAEGQAQTGSEAGRQQLLQGIEAKPSASTTALNSAILSQNPNYLNQVEGAYKPFSNLVTGLQSGAADINKQIAQNQATAQQEQQTAQNQITGQINTLNTGVQNQLADLQKQYNAYNTEAANLASNLQQGTLPTGYGVDPGLQAFINNNINPWMAANAGNAPLSYNFANAIPQMNTVAAPTLEQAATAQDYANAQAFQNLINGVSTGLPTPVITPATASQAGTYSTGTLPTINNQALAGDIQAGLASGAGQANVSSGPYNQYLKLLAALDKYQGIPLYKDTAIGGPAGVGQLTPQQLAAYEQQLEQQYGGINIA